MIKAVHLREVITLTLKELADLAKKPKIYSKAAVELLMLTAAQESHGGKYLKQDDNNPKTLFDGPALGIYQIEPTTAADLFTNYLAFKADLLGAQITFATSINEGNWRQNMMGNIPYQTVMARLQYYRKPGSLPEYTDIDGLAKYYKVHWNTHLGKATVEEAIKNYWRFGK